MKTLNLSGEWKLIRVKTKETVPAQVPGDTHSALLNAGKIPDPYWADNELAVQWVGREDWIYSRKFSVSEGMLSEKSVFLNCDCLDTISDISINGRKAGSTENMFLRYRFEVKKFLKPGENTIEILFHSAENTAVQASKKLKYPVPHGNNPVQSPNRNLVRKVQCHSGWDWGPCLMVAGIYGDIYLGAYSDARIEHVYCDQKHSRGLCEVKVDCEVFSPDGEKTTMKIILGKEEVTKKVQLNPGLNNITGTLTVKNPQLWWPNGFGSQHLYDLSVTVGGSEIKKKLGLRKIELISEEDKMGLSMSFRVNGAEIFAKGADWIPCDALPQRQTREAIEYLLDSAAKANMNMLRIWGGGQYEHDYFYEMCDEKGIMIWQDFMFACALYPASKEFLDLVRQEAIYQVKRLRDYACIAIWCGNNEDIGALNWFKESKENRDRYLVDYDRLNEGVLGNIVRELDPNRVFWPSSPCGGPGDYSDAFHNDKRGDMHYWDVWFGGKTFDNFLKIFPRFCSEFGYQSFPSMDTVRAYAPEKQFNVTSPVMEHHQKCNGGNSKIIEMFSRCFRLPEGFENFIFLSQIQQGIAIKTAVEHWRRLRPNCMGTIYWQLNDNWPVCSWASLNYQGSWKLLHYMAKRFYEPVLVSAIQDDDKKQVGIFLTNDTLQSKKAKISIQVRDLTGKVTFEDNITAVAPASSAKQICKYDLSKLTSKLDSHFMTLKMDLDGKIFHNEHFFCVWKKYEFPKPEIKIKTKAVKEGFEVKLETDLPALYVSLSAEGISGEFDDNCFTLLPKEGKTIIFKPGRTVTTEAFKKALSVKHLRQTYT
ncbi:MAG: glycoside hydrolase family 2 protein [Victivallales bacterium]